MMTLISRVIVAIRLRLPELLKKFQLQNLLAVLVAGVLLIANTGNVTQQDNSELGAIVRDRVHQTDQADRPKTTGEWEQERRETEGKPGERLKRIAKESGEAFKQFGSGYVEGAKETGRDLQQGAAKLGEDLSLNPSK